MRIIAGRLRGRRIRGLAGKTVRPSSARVREALFSIIGREIAGSRVLEPFAGTGMFGFEALSRGASEVVFVDNARSVTAALERNADDLGLSSATTILTLDARTALNRLLPAQQLFDVLFLDPPYDSDLLRPWLAEGSAPGLMASEGLLIVERSSTASECRPPASLERVLHRTYGHTTVEMFRKETR